MAHKKISYKKIALALSACAMVIWALLGAGTSLAWFTDTSHEVKNIFHTAEFDLVVSHRLPDGTYDEIDAEESVFNDEALYEPGYVQVVYLKVENRGTVPFEYNTAVSVTDYVPATNVYGQTFQLQDHLKFGVVTADTEAALLQKVENREDAKQCATLSLNNYTTDKDVLNAGGAAYMALIVRMPETVDNVANYRGSPQPKVELGLIVQASQIA